MWARGEESEGERGGEVRARGGTESHMSESPPQQNEIIFLTRQKSVCLPLRRSHRRAMGRMLSECMLFLDPDRETSKASHFTSVLGMGKESP